MQKIIALATLLALTFGAFGQDIQPVIIVPENTPITARLTSAVSSKDSHENDAVQMTVTEDINVAGQTVIKSGASVIGRIIKAQAARRVGKGGQIAIALEYVKTVTGERIPVQAHSAAKGKGSAGAITTGVVLTSVFLCFGCGALWLLKHGKETEIPWGTMLTVYTLGDAKLDMSKAPKLAPAPVAVAAVHTPEANAISGSTVSVYPESPESLGDVARRYKAAAKDKPEIK